MNGLRNEQNMTPADLRRDLTVEFGADHPASTVLLARMLLARHPNDAQTLVRLGHVLSELANYDEAESVLLKALEYCDESRQAIVYGKLGHLFMFRGEYHIAAEWYQKAVEAAPLDATGYIYLGSTLARQGRLSAAEIVHRKATACTEGCIDEAYYNLGLVLRGQGRLEESRDCFESALQLDSNYQEAREALEDVTAAIGYLSRRDSI